LKDFPTRKYLILLFWSSLLAVSLGAAPQQLESLTAGGKTFHRVKITQVTPDAIYFTHKGGLAQLPLSDLPPKLAAQFGYHPDKAEAYRNELQQAAEERKKQLQAQLENIRDNSANPLEQLSPAERALSRFREMPTLHLQVDLREFYREMELYTKRQGRRPSCAVFAVVGALEYQNARFRGEKEILSEEYLIWATRESLGMTDTPNRPDEDRAGQSDAGFSLIEVAQALKTYGIPLQESMPNTFGTGMEAITSPGDSIVQEALDRTNIQAYMITGRSPRDRIAALIQCLNEGVPVVAGMAWPHSNTLRNTHLLSEQKPVNNYFHAVTIVGYQCISGQLEDTTFCFKNSWGPRWGEAGYGYVTYDYLTRWMTSAIFLDVK